MAEISVTQGLKDSVGLLEGASKHFCQEGIHLRSDLVLGSVVLIQYLALEVVMQSRKTSDSDSNCFFCLTLNLICSAFLSWNNTDHSENSHVQS